APTVAGKPIIVTPGVLTLTATDAFVTGANPGIDAVTVVVPVASGWSATPPAAIVVADADCPTGIVTLTVCAVAAGVAASAAPRVGWPSPPPSPPAPPAGPTPPGRGPLVRPPRRPLAPGTRRRPTAT